MQPMCLLGCLCMVDKARCYMLENQFASKLL